ncbi:glycosyltransferase family 2 protein [Acidithiobacillus ferrivorans]|uniref:Glycosyltransferase n=1 Tax=Acidithiobacillus ferrivorans TaxID=160808 RepID=A0A7T5BFT1_9PROT|nr:glycosyltransferase [Acidithiobacillus ferrivorans]
MEIFIVIPCLNEEDCITATCASLGFGDGLEPPGRLVLVDNGSSDGTAKLMLAIQRASPPGHVLITQEHRRGYVAARRAGMAKVIDVAQRDQVPEEDVLILQADADTIYLPDYLRPWLTLIVAVADTFWKRVPSPAASSISSFLCSGSSAGRSIMAWSVGWRRKRGKS